MLALLGAAMLLVGGCDIYTDPSPTPAATPSASATPTSETTPTEAPEPEPTEDAPTPPPESELPGEALEGYPEEGTTLTVVGVPAVEELNVRLGPGTGYDVVGRLASDAEVGATGRIRALEGEQGVWYEITSGAGEDDDALLGWVSAAFLAELGANRDITDAFPRPPAADTVNGLVSAVVDGWRDGATGPDGVLAGGPVTSTTMQMRVDVLDDLDDSVRGVRLFVVSERTDSGYRVQRVSLTQICARGVSGGTCA